MFEHIAERRPDLRADEVRRSADPATRERVARAARRRPGRAMAHYRVARPTHFADDASKPSTAPPAATTTLARELGHAPGRADDRRHQRRDRHAQPARPGAAPRARRAVAGVGRASRRCTGCTAATASRWTRRCRSPASAARRERRARRDHRRTTTERTDGDRRARRRRAHVVARRASTSSSCDLGVRRPRHTRLQGATVDRAVVVTGGWQTARESAYVEASAARARAPTGSSPATSSTATSTPTASTTSRR